MAIKKMKVFDHKTTTLRAYREISILRNCKHPCIVGIYDIIEPKDLNNFTDLFVVLELADSDLRQVISSSMSI